MSKATRNGARNAREQIAAQQAAARKAEQRRRLLIVGGSVGLVLVIVVAFLVVKGLAKPAKTLGSGHLPAAVTRTLANVPSAALASVGPGSLSGPGLPIKPISGKPLTAGGKPEMLYIGAEYCPYCAAMRWSMAVALSRFGTFGPFTGIHSTSKDVDPNTATLTFLNQQYTSKYLTFTPIENLTVDKKPLQNPPQAEHALWVKYDSSANGVGFPFIDFGNKVVLTGPLFDPKVLAGLTWSHIPRTLKNPANPLGMNSNGAPNYGTASTGKTTSNAPASVCTAGPIPSIQA